MPRFARFLISPLTTLLLLLIPLSSWAWTVTERCELRQETPAGTVNASATANGILLYLPEGLIANDTWVSVSIGTRRWRTRMVGGAVEIKGGKRPFLEKNWMTVRAGGKNVLGCNLYGSSTAWEQLMDCEPSSGSEWVALSGKITSSTDDRIISAIRRQKPKGLLLDSIGGLPREAQRIGYAVREAGLETRVQTDAECLSECAFILAAGSPRTVESGGQVGISASLITKGLGVLLGDQGAVEDSAAYLNRMGVNGGKMAVLATAKRHEGIRFFTPTELRELGFGNSSDSK